MMERILYSGLWLILRNLLVEKGLLESLPEMRVTSQVFFLRDKVERFLFTGT